MNTRWGPKVRPLLAHDGVLLVSVPNFGHWYPRARVAIGRFDYDRRGILDRDHVRFFTTRSFERLVASRAYTVVRRAGTGLPIGVLDRDGEGTGAHTNPVARAVAQVDEVSVAVRPQLFAYQFIYELRPDRSA